MAGRPRDILARTARCSQHGFGSELTRAITDTSWRRRVGARLRTDARAMVDGAADRTRAVASHTSITPSRGRVLEKCGSVKEGVLPRHMAFELGTRLPADSESTR